MDNHPLDSKLIKISQEIDRGNERLEQLEATTKQQSMQLARLQDALDELTRYVYRPSDG